MDPTSPNASYRTAPARRAACSAAVLALSALPRLVTGRAGAGAGHGRPGRVELAALSDLQRLGSQVGLGRAAALFCRASTSEGHYFWYQSR